MVTPEYASEQFTGWFEARSDSGRYLDLLPHLDLALNDARVRLQVVALRVLSHLGAARAADSGMLRLWRTVPTQPDAQLAGLRVLGYRRGAYRAWMQMRRTQMAASAPAPARAEWWSLLGYLAGLRRDFEAAQAAYDAALATDPGNAWARVERSYVLEMADRYTEALAHSREALRLQPGYRPAIQACSHQLTLIGQDDDAFAMLSEATATLQSAALAAQLHALQVDRELYDEAAVSLDRYEQCSPRAEREERQWLSARRADLALHRGDRARAIELARAAEQPFYTALADRLQTQQSPAQRVLLPVGFVRQHWVTCAPATLTALSNFWQRPAAHLEIAETICYDGTPAYNERSWAVRQGFVAREFTVDWDSACALLDAGVPFTLVTVATSSAHLQAVVGYDATRRSLLIRDPFQRTCGEFDADALFDTHRASGPRGMVLVPPEYAARISGVRLPEESLWDRYHEVMGALETHQRSAAQGAVQGLIDAAPTHRLTLQAIRAVAMYDGDESAGLAAIDRLLEQFPDDPNLLLSRLAALSVLGTREQQLALLEPAATTPRPDPVIVTRYAQMLSVDGRALGEAIRLAARGLNRHPQHAAGWSVAGDILWARGERDDALEHYRAASCLQDTNEEYAATYFRAARWQRETDRALTHLRERAQRLVFGSAYPSITLFLQLEALGLTDEAFAALDTASTQRPADADLAAFRAETFLRYGRIDAARALIREASGPRREAQWLRLDAHLAREEGDRARALALARQAAAMEPLNVQLHRTIASLLDQLQGRSAAIAYLREVCARFDHHWALHEALLGWLVDEPLSEAEHVLRHLLQINGLNAWTLRELAINLSRQNRHPDAQAFAQRALAVAPEQSMSHSSAGFVSLRAGDLAHARTSLRRALELSIDNDYALSTLVELAPDLAQRCAALAFIKDELVRQVTFGDGLLAFQRIGRTTLPADELLALLNEGLATRPDLWHAWVAVAAQLNDMGRSDEAAKVAADATERFPLLPRIRFEQGRACQLLGDREGARRCLRAALDMNAVYIPAVRSYVDTVLDEGREFERALAVIDPALFRDPDAADLRALRGVVLSRMGQACAARSETLRALERDPRIGWAWSFLRDLARDGADPQLVVNTARMLCERRPGDAGCWLALARYAPGSEESLNAARRAIELEPANVAAYEAQLSTLMSVGRYSDADVAVTALPDAVAHQPSLRVYAARLTRLRGDKAAANALLRELTQADPNQFELWRTTAEWTDADADVKGYVQAARQMVRLEPNSAIAHAWLGDALLQNGDRAEARPSFERARVLDPSYEFTTNRLFDLLWDAKEVEAAQALVTSTIGSHRSACLYARAVRVAAALGRRDEALAALGQMLALNDQGDWSFTTALRAFNEARWSSAVLPAVEAAIKAGPCQRPAIDHWLRNAHEHRWFGSFYRKCARVAREDPGHAFKHAFMEFAARLGEHRLLTRFVGEFDDVLRADPDCWGSVTYAYLQVRDHLQVSRWAHDWRARGDLPSWALDNVAVALRHIGDDAQAHEVSERSLQLEPDNPEAQVWFALDLALADDLPALARSLQALPERALREYYADLVGLLSAYRSAAAAGDSVSAVPAFAALRTKADGNAMLRRVRRVLGSRLAEQYSPSAWQRWWRRWRMTR